MQRIAVNSPVAAIRFNEAVDRTAGRLAHFPESGRIVNERLSLRSVSLPRWGCHLLYVAEHGGVVVLTVRSGRRRNMWDVPASEEDSE